MRFLIRLTHISEPGEPEAGHPQAEGTLRMWSGRGMGTAWEGPLQAVDGVLTGRIQRFGEAQHRHRYTRGRKHISATRTFCGN
jgi:hypothetical protein